MSKIKVLITDDSPFMRRLLESFIESDPELELVGKASNGKQALEMIATRHPDVVTLDHAMPILNGLETLKIIMAKNPLPVIMVSSHTQKGTRLTLEALELGAFDFITKTEGRGPMYMPHLQGEFLTKIKAAARQCRHQPDIHPPQKDHLGPPTYWQPFSLDLKLIIIGTSSGGPKALQTIIPAFPGDLPAAMIIVQHMPGGFTASLAERLDRNSQLSVREAGNNDTLKPGLALVAPGGYHLLVDADRKVMLNKKNPLWGVRPAIDHTLKSAAPIFKNNLVGVILTGMGRDGTDGLLEVRKYGGRTIVEDEETCVVFGMPRSAIKAGAADIVLPLPQVPSFITGFFQEESHERNDI